MVTLLSSVLLAFEIGFLVIFFVVGKKKNNFFSKTNVLFFIPILIIMFLLYLIATVNTIDDVKISDVIACISAAVRAFTLDIKIYIIEDTVNSNFVYKIAFYFGIFFTSLTIFDSLIGVVKNYYINHKRVKKALKSNCDFLLNIDETSLLYAKKNNAIFFGNFSSSDTSMLFKKGFGYINNEFNASSLKALKSSRNKNFIDFNYNLDKYIKYCDELKEYVDNNTNNNNFLRLSVNLDKTDLFMDSVVATKKLNTYVSCFNKYDLIGLDFSWENSLAHHLPRSFFDENGCISTDKSINVVFLGFGKKAQVIFKNMILNNHFAYSYNDKYYNHLVNYYAFDKSNEAVDNFFFDRLNNQINFDSSKVKTEKICNFEFKKLNLFSANKDEGVNEFLNKLTLDTNSYTYIIISYDDDINNFNLYHNLEKKLEYRDNVKYFIYTKNKLDISSKVTTFGQTDVILSHESIVNNLYTNLGINLHMSYSNLKEASYKEKVDIWSKLSYIDQSSNINSIIHLRSKLNIMGFDIDIKSNNKINLNDFLSKYTNKSYDDYFNINLKNTIGYIEHLRWNAFYILNDFTTMELNETLVNGKLKTKDISCRKHCCLIDYYSLDLYHKSLSRILNKSIDDVETYKYDLMSLYSINEILDGSGYFVGELYEKVCKE